LAIVKAILSLRICTDTIAASAVFTTASSRCSAPSRGEGERSSID
jgi:hypothetical protein